MTASEFAFLTLGLVLGVLGGAAVVEVVRTRLRSPREIRLTVTPDSVPRRRATTLAEDAFVAADAAGARGGPADGQRTEHGVDRPVRGAPPVTATRTNVQSPGGSAEAAGSVGTPAALASGAIAVPVHRETDWTLEAMRTAAAQPADQAIRDQQHSMEARAEAAGVGAAGVAAEGVAAAGVPAMGVGAARVGAAGAGVGASERATEPDTEANREPGTEEEHATSADSTPAGECGEVRRVADERCAVAARARSEAERIEETLRTAQRTYDDHHTRAEQASLLADPRAIRSAKESAQEAFREARERGTSPGGVETAAREWLNEINRINREAREATAAVKLEREAANALVMTVERLTVEANAMRVSAEVADAACLAARQAVADCQEAASADRAVVGWPPAPSVGQGGGRPGTPDDDESELAAAFEGTGAGEPAILRMLRGDRTTLGRVVEQVAGDDAMERRRWQRALGDLVEAIVARAIEAAALTFPLEHSFWGAFSLDQSREIASALASLGYRFDGLGGWTDDRVPSHRDLSLAVGYAGQDPMRVRRWPNEQEMGDLMRDVVVAADEYLVENAGGLTLGELVDVLGRRADPLADLWNEWGRVRPLLLAGG